MNKILKSFNAMPLARPSRRVDSMSVFEFQDAFDSAVLVYSIRILELYASSVTAVYDITKRIDIEAMHIVIILRWRVLIVSLFAFFFV